MLRHTFLQEATPQTSQASLEVVTVSGGSIRVLLRPMPYIKPQECEFEGLNLQIFLEFWVLFIPQVFYLGKEVSSSYMSVKH